VCVFVSVTLLVNCPNFFFNV